MRASFPPREVAHGPERVEMSKKTTRSLRIAALVYFRPNKRGSLEDRLIAIARAAKERGHHFTLFSFGPVHPCMREELALAGAGWRPLAWIEKHPVQAAYHLAMDFDVVELSLVPPRGRVALAAYAAWPARILFIDHFSGPVPAAEKRRGRVSRLLDFFTMTRVRQVAGVSEYVRQRCQQRFRLKKAKTLVIYNGIDTNRFAPPSTRRNGPTVRMVAAGSLIPEKGFHVLIRALSQVPQKNWHLRVVGEGPERRKLEELVEEFGLVEKVEFLGLRDDLEAINRDADILAHPCLWQEAFGLTIVEGMSCGCCVLASRAGGIPELIEHNHEGILIEPGDVEAWADAISRVLEDHALRGKLGEAARARAVRDFDLQKSVQRSLAFYEEALHRDGG